MVTMAECAARHGSAGNEPSAVTVVSPCGTPWQLLLQTRPNVLAIGPRRATDAFVANALRSFRPPLVSVECRQGLSLKRAETLVLYDVDQLDRNAQARLTAWLEDPANVSTQVVSATAISLFQRVLAKRFIDTLYYRLNTIVLDVRSA